MLVLIYSLSQKTKQQLKHGCSVDIPDKDGLTALAYCIRNENIKSIKQLIKCGCKIDMNIINSNECLRNQLIKYPLIEQLLYQEITTVKSLMELTRLKIRKCLDQRLISKVNQLPLPQKLKDYVSMRETFGYSTPLHTTSKSSSNLGTVSQNGAHLAPDQLNNTFDIDNSLSIDLKNKSKCSGYFLPNEPSNNDFDNLNIITNENGVVLSQESNNLNRSSPFTYANNNNLLTAVHLHHSNASSFSSSSSSAGLSSLYSPSKSSGASSSDKETPAPSKKALDNVGDSFIRKKTSIFRQATKKLGLDKKFRTEI
jgi:hypothetical protein